MKKGLLAIILIFTSVFCFAYSKPKHDDSITVQGMIHVYGNEPFTYIGIVCDSGEEYSLKADKKVLSELQKTQGKKIQIKGLPEKSDKPKESDGPVFKPNTLKNGDLNVIEWKFVN